MAMPESTAKEPLLEPGKYILIQDVNNPKCDRRVKRDWREDPIFHKGLTLVVEDHADSFTLNDIPVTRHYQTMYAYHGSSYKSIAVRESLEQDDYDALRTAALLPYLVRVTTECLGDVFVGNGSVEEHMAPELLAILIDAGILNLQTIRNAVKTLNGMDEGAWVLLRKTHGL